MHKSVAHVLAFGVVTLSFAARADIVKHVDKDGVISFTNTPSPKKSRSPEHASMGSMPPVLPSGSAPERYSRYDSVIRNASGTFQIPEDLIRAVIKVESGYDPRAVSRANARGLMQLIPETAERMGVTDIFDPYQNINGGVRYLRVLANLFNGDLQLTVAAYNAGEGAVIHYGGIPPFPETQAYVVNVVAYYRQYQQLSLQQQQRLNVNAPR
jgi:soluble lytic murein transglycosylase-like protein